MRKETNTRYQSYLASSCEPECQMTEELIPVCLRTDGRQGDLSGAGMVQSRARANC